MRSLHRSIAIALLAMLFTGCGDCADTNGLTEPDDLDVSVDADTDDVGVPDTTTPDADDEDAHTLDTGPSCPALQSCGEDCCDEDQLCLAGSCVTPGASCESSLQCAADEFCEPTLGQCLPDLGDACIYRPEGNVFDPVVDVAWQATDDTPAPTHRQVMMTPSVVDITGDGIPEIIFSTFADHYYTNDGILRAVNGRTYEPVFDLTDPAHRVSAAASLAVGDIDRDGKNEIIAVLTGGHGLIAFDDHDTGWAEMWRTAPFPMGWDGAYLADLDGDGSVEVVGANRVFDGVSGAELCVNAAVSDTPQNSLVADLDGDGDLEVVAASGAFSFTRNPDGTADCPTAWTYDDGVGGYPAVADFGQFVGDTFEYGNFDGLPEVAIVTRRAQDALKLHDGRTGQRIWMAPMPTSGHPHYTDATCAGSLGAGPPTIADFNGDGLPNVATAGSCFYVVFNERGELMWKLPSQDFSSRVTGSSVFDFQGDGKAEVVYGDECFLRVYDGTGNGDGTTDIIFQIANTSGTTRELPVIVDVDRDYHAEIVVISNDYSAGLSQRCREDWPGFDDLGGSFAGVRVIRDVESRWVATRPVWNQHAYSVTNVCDGLDDSLCPGTANLPGAIPSPRLDNWRVEHLNNFRQNVQGEGLFNAPDLVVNQAQGTCNDDHLSLHFIASNQGSRGVIEGLPVALYYVDGDQELLIDVVPSDQLLAPGGRLELTYDWYDAPITSGDGEQVEVIARINDDGTGQRTLRECNEDNNELRATISCPCTNNDHCPRGHYCHNSGSCWPIQG
ncbi:hypothetical protein DL240_00760 [Lujinxingia litoralis]|uniref:CARDB domain-containing protein n=1 Tax=Lujinxingia litoralis TaxID=2211119 RepID=A0A328CDK8_9DELT|nr:VCBS repeat-containing protein [Lujinxingia litoralis]RAL24773.1 hypothetical protein DL240_00760 [Lujinxingia litoralis]